MRANPCHTAGSSVIFCLLHGDEKILTMFLPPANEVWGKVICLHLSVILSTGRCMVRGVPGLRGVPGPAACLVQGGTWSRGMCLVETQPQTATALGGTHPTGMHYCYNGIL